MCAYIQVRQVIYSQHKGLVLMEKNSTFFQVRFIDKSCYIISLPFEVLQLKNNNIQIADQLDLFLVFGYDILCRQSFFTVCVRHSDHPVLKKVNLHKSDTKNLILGMAIFVWIIINLVHKLIPVYLHPMEMLRRTSTSIKGLSVILEKKFVLSSRFVSGIESLTNARQKELHLRLPQPVEVRHSHCP